MAGPLAPGNSNSLRSRAFNQTGTINWVDLFSRIYSHALETLDRYAKANVDAATVGICGHMCRQFEMPASKKEMVLNRIFSLPRVSLFGNVASIGFGLHHILEDLVDTDEGLTGVALCGCLTVSYDSFYAAQVLRSLCYSQNVPDEILPGTRRWKSLVEICSGIFNSKELNLKIEGLQYLLVPRATHGNQVFEPTPHEVLASALVEVARISSGDLESCTFTGGLDCAWLGAVAEFLFDIAISVVTTDNIACYESKTGSRLPHGECKIVLVPPERNVKRMTLMRRASDIPSGKAIFKESSASLFTSRYSWDTVLENAYGSAAESLLRGKTSANFATLLLYTAQRSALLSQGDPHLNWGEEYRWLDFDKNLQGPRGDDFLRFACWRLPELKYCLCATEYRNSSSITESAARGYLQAIHEACDCSTCRRETYDEQIFEQTLCLVKVSGSIIRLAYLLSVTDTCDMLPTAKGLRDLYDSSLCFTGPIFGYDFSLPGIKSLLFQVFGVFRKGDSVSYEEQFRK
ncbi:MAG: hypothetical protein M1821_005061 [Bathelium mastoideum]|nr:MAG: hypothetical protein M1821_005061 [Bathelium mastoideum]